MNSKRFVFVIEDLYGGGAQKSLINTAEGLRQRGHRVTVFILRDLIEHRLPPELEVINLALVNGVTKALSNVLVEKWQAWRIARAIRRLAPDVVLSCSCDKITRHLDHPNLWFWVKSNMLASRYTPKAKAKAKAKLQRFYNGRKVIGCSQGWSRACCRMPNSLRSGSSPSTTPTSGKASCAWPPSRPTCPSGSI